MTCFKIRRMRDSFFASISDCLGFVADKEYYIQYSGLSIITFYPNFKFSERKKLTKNLLLFS